MSACATKYLLMQKYFVNARKKIIHPPACRRETTNKLKWKHGREAATKSYKSFHCHRSSS